jgi:hypothetical protein
MKNLIAWTAKDERNTGRLEAPHELQAAPTLAIF